MMGSRAALLAIATFASVFPLSAVAGAQEDAARDGEFSVQRFFPAPGGKNLLTVEGARVEGKFGYSGGLVVNYASSPFVVRSCQSATNCDAANAVNPVDTHVVRHLITGDVLGSFIPMERLQVGLRLPVVFADGDGINTATGTASEQPLSATGLGDPTITGKARLVGVPTDPVVIGAALDVRPGIGHLMAENSYIGNSSPVELGVRGIVDAARGPVSIAANLTGVWREAAKLGNTEIGPELRYGAGVGYRVSPIFQALLEGFGSTKFSGKNGTNALEIDVGVRFTPLQSKLSFLLGGGAGVVQGVGVPVARGFLGAMLLDERGDSDGDGVPDALDKCPTVAEDQDGHEDDDGCVDDDNDGDGIADAEDKCVDKAEDYDGFQDGDGCPDLDNDGDKIPDADDRCPLKPETYNGVDDTDGCPDVPDRDKDGVGDAEDKCPDEPEDTDGYQDTDGCPDPDNDGDGIKDELDECVDQPETVNGYKDEDGCPDEGAAAPAAPEAAPSADPKADPKKAPPKK